MLRVRPTVLLLAAGALALGALGPASAGTQAAPRYGGTLVVGMGGGDADTLDPTVSMNSSSNLIFRSMCERLYEYDARLQLVPVLAAAPPVLSKDKLSYTVRLRRGIEFNDGTPFDAQAVVATVERFVDYPGSKRASDFAPIDRVSASGPYTVVYHMKARDSTFTGNSYVLSPTQLEKLGDSFATRPVCVGPFMFDNRVVGDHVTVIKSPSYYDQKDVYLDKIVYKPMQDAAAGAAALRAGDIQVLSGVTTTEVPELKQDSRVRVAQAYLLGWSGLNINIGNRNGVRDLPYATVDNPLARSPKLRQAFEEAIDRGTLTKVVFDGLGKPSCTMVSPVNTTWYDATKVACTPYDPKEARKLVAASGFSNPTVHLMVRDRTDELRLAQFIQAQEAAIGIDVVIDSFDSATYVARRTAGNFDVSLTALLGGVDPSSNIYSFAATSGSTNYSGYSNPRLDLILANGSKATHPKARSTLYRAAQRIIASDRPYIVLYNTNSFAAFSASLAGVELTNGGLLLANGRFK